MPPFRAPFAVAAATVLAAVSLLALAVPGFAGLPPGARFAVVVAALVAGAVAVTTLAAVAHAALRTVRRLQANDATAKALLSDSAQRASSLAAELRVAESRQQSNDVLLQALMDYAPAAIFVKDGEGRLLSVNRAFCELAGTTVENVVGRRDSELFSGPRFAEIIANDRAVLQQNRPFAGEEALAFPDGERTFLVAKVPVETSLFPTRVLVGIATDITERKKAEQELSETKELLNAVLQQLPVGVGLFTRGGDWRLTNARLSRFVGDRIASADTTDEMRWRCWDENGRLVDRSQWPGQRALRGESVRGMDFLHLEAGVETWVRVSTAPFMKAGEVVGGICVLQEIDREKRAAQALQASEERMRLATTVARIGFWDWDVATDRLVWSDGHFELLEYDPASTKPSYEAWIQRVHPDDRALVLGALDAARMRRAEYECVYRVELPSGTVRWISTRGHFFYDRQGACTRMIGILLDITERKHMEDALRASESRFRQLAESVPHLVWTANADGRVDYFNHAVANYAGGGEGADGALDWRRMMHPADLESTAQAWERAAAAGTLYEHEHRLLTASGQYRWHLSRAYPARDPITGYVKWFGTATDIEDQKRAQEMLELRVEERTAKLKATIGDLEAFSYSIAHDMRAPLRAMQGYAAILIEECLGKLDGQSQAYLQRIQNSAERLDRLIQDVLDYSRIARQELPLERVDTASLVQDIIFSYPNLQPQNADIHVEASLPPVTANAAALTQVFSNLLANAVKFVPPGTRPSVNVRSEVADAVVRIWIEDNGIGIDGTSQMRLFQMFQRLNRPDQYEGTGMGLAIVRKAIERMGGRVGVESEPDKGSRFWFELNHASVEQRGAPSGRSLPPEHHADTALR